MNPMINVHEYYYLYVFDVHSFIVNCEGDEKADSLGFYRGSSDDAN